MVYISASGSMSEKRSNWRLSIVSDFFWAIVNFFGLLYVSGALVAVHERCAHARPPACPFLPHPCSAPPLPLFWFWRCAPPPTRSQFQLPVCGACARARRLALRARPAPHRLLTPPLRPRNRSALAQADETKKIGTVHEKEDGGRGGGGGDDGKPKGHKRPGQAGSNVKSMADRRRDPGNMPAGGG